MKLLILTIGLLISSAAMAEPPIEFEVIGVHCGNPYLDDRPNFKAAELNADNEANRRCYPYQFVRLRLGRFQHDFETCRFPHLGAKVTSLYTCAR